ncbi:MAG: nucleotidyltransferase family protein [Prevotella sp.]|nr:nucleotidyltransferase family protein [Prevotella sp.]
MDENRNYLEFLRYCLDERAAVPSCVEGMDWDALYLFARHQTVVATYWRGIERLNATTDVKLSEESVLKWMARYKKVEKDSRAAYKKAAWVWKNFKSEGFRSCLLKGQGNALLYPSPFLRTPGDIDIWVEGGDEKVIAYIDSVVPGMKRVYHHIEFISTGKTPIEVHYRPAWMSNPLHNRRLQQWFEAHADACFSNKREEWGFCVPTYEFNSVYLLAHIYNHLIREGVGLRHVVDYYHLLSGYPEGTPKPSARELERLGLLKMAGAMMWVLHEVLGLPEEKLLCAPNKRIGRMFLHEILEGGNFGKFDNRAMGGEQQAPVKHNLKVLLRDARLLTYFPSECLWEPWFRVWHWAWRKKHGR